MSPALPSSQSCGEGWTGELLRQCGSRNGVTTPWPLPHPCHDDFGQPGLRALAVVSPVRQLGARGTTTAWPLAGRKAHFLTSRLSHLDAVRPASVSFFPNLLCTIQNASCYPHSTDEQTELRQGKSLAHTNHS